MRPRLISRGKDNFVGKDAKGRQASMRPRLISRGKDTGSGYSGRKIPGFNEAATDQSRKVNRIGVRSPQIRELQ